MSTPSTVSVPSGRAGGRPRRLSGSGRKIVFTVHIAAALGLFGAALVLLVAGLHAATRNEPQDAHAIYTLLRFLTFSVDLPLAVITLLGGLALALTSKWRIFRYRWVTGKLALYLANLAVGVTLIGPSIDTMIDVTEREPPSESSTRWTLVLLAGAQVALLTAATLGVLKPGRRRGVTRG